MTPVEPLILRTARATDLPAVSRIECASFTDAWPPDLLGRELVADPLRLALIAERAGSVAGYLMAWRMVDQLHVLNIAVDPAARQLGVGSALLRGAAREAARSGLTEITLEVRSSNQSARSFYAGHGFETVGVRRRYYADTGEDAQILTCEVSRILD